MSSIAVPAYEAVVPEPKPSRREQKSDRPLQPEAVKPTQQRKKQDKEKDKAAARERYFLVNPKVAGAEETIAAGRELTTEPEVVIAAFLAQTTFYVVTEYRVNAQVRGPAPQLIKEGLK